jgi:hypothetical protein
MAWLIPHRPIDQGDTIAGLLYTAMRDAMPHEPTATRLKSQRTAHSAYVSHSQEANSSRIARTSPSPGPKRGVYFGDDVLRRRLFTTADYLRGNRPEQ